MGAHQRWAETHASSFWRRLIGQGNKSEVTLQVPSISRLFYMGNFALTGEPSMEQGWESHDGMAGAVVFARWLIEWAPSSTHVTPQWVVLTSWAEAALHCCTARCKRYTRGCLKQKHSSTHINVYIYTAFIVCWNIPFFHTLAPQKEAHRLKH